jgi:hypothetical protein
VALLLTVISCANAPTASGTCLGPQPFGADTTVTGIAFTDDCAAPDGLLGDVYEFTVATQTNILITMTPSGFAGGLGLFAGPYVEGGTPRMIFTEFGRGAFGAKAFLPAGTYYLVAGSDEAAGGAYTLTSAPTTTTPCTETTTAWYTIPGADISGLLTDADCVGAPGVRQDLFRLEMASGEQIAVSIEMSKMGGVMWRRDGSASAANLAQFNTVQPNVTAGATFTAPARAAFNVHVASDNLAGGTLSYTLHIR